MTLGLPIPVALVGALAGTVIAGLILGWATFVPGGDAPAGQQHLRR